MAKPQIKYRSGYKYQLAEAHEVQVGIQPAGDVRTDFIDLSASGLLTVKKGYAWDGPSGPARDTKDFMRGSLVHDALYQLMRNSHIGQEWRKQADRELKKIVRQDGMSWFRAWFVHRAVRRAGGPAASPESRKPIHRAP